MSSCSIIALIIINKSLFLEILFYLHARIFCGTQQKMRKLFYYDGNTSSPSRALWAIYNVLCTQYGFREVYNKSLPDSVYRLCAIERVDYVQYFVESFRRDSSQYQDLKVLLTSIWCFIKGIFGYMRGRVYAVAFV